MFERTFPFTVDVSFVCLLLGAIFVRGSVVLEETNFCFELGFPTLKKVIWSDLYTWLKIISNHDTLANKCTKENIRINFKRRCYSSYYETMYVFSSNVYTIIF